MDLARDIVQVFCWLSEHARCPGIEEFKSKLNESINSLTNRNQNLIHLDLNSEELLAAIHAVPLDPEWLLFPRVTPERINEIDGLIGCCGDFNDSGVVHVGAMLLALSGSYGSLESVRTLLSAGITRNAIISGEVTVADYLDMVLPEENRWILEVTRQIRIVMGISVCPQRSEEEEHHDDDLDEHHTLYLEDGEL